MAEFPIIAKLGGKKPVFEYLRAKGLVQTERAIGMWSAEGRGTIPGDSARELMLWADEKGIAYTAADFSLPPAQEASAA